MTHCGHKLEAGDTILTTDLMLQEFVARIFRSEARRYDLAQSREGPPPLHGEPVTAYSSYL